MPNPPSGPVLSRGRAVSAHHLAFWLFATFQFFYLLTSTGRVRTPDEYNTFYTAESLALHGSTAVPQAVQLNNFYGRYDVHGQPRAAYPPGQALLCVPWYTLGRVLARLPGVPAEDTDLVVAFTCCLSSATFSALTVTLFFLLLVRIGTPERVSLFAAAMLGLATPIFAYSAWLFSEPITSAIFIGAALLLFGASSQPISLRTAAVGGLILGLAAMVRPTDALAIPVFALAILMRDGRRSWPAAFLFCTSSAFGVAALLTHNAILFGSPVQFGYPAVAEGAKRLNTFETPLWKGLYGFLFSPGKSVFLFAPPVILGLAGLRRLWKLERGVATVAVVIPLVYLFFFARYTQWEGGYCVGPRYLVPSIVLLCLGLGPMLVDVLHESNISAPTEERDSSHAAKPRRLRRFAVLLLVVGALVQGVSLATSFMEDEVPRGHYYDANWTYRLSYSLGGQMHLLWKYLTNSQPVRLGLGWDRWFVFLYKGGISATTLTLFGAIMLVGLGVSAVGLARRIAQ